MNKDLAVTIEETFELPSWFKNWVEGIYQSPRGNRCFCNGDCFKKGRRS